VILMYRSACVMLQYRADTLQHCFTGRILNFPRLLRIRNPPDDVRSLIISPSEEIFRGRSATLTELSKLSLRDSELKVESRNTLLAIEQAQTKRSFLLISYVVARLAMPAHETQIVRKEEASWLPH